MTFYGERGEDCFKPSSRLLHRINALSKESCRWDTMVCNKQCTGFLHAARSITGQLYVIAFIAKHSFTGPRLYTKTQFVLLYFCLFVCFQKSIQIFPRKKERTTVHTVWSLGVGSQPQDSICDVTLSIKMGTGVVCYAKNYWLRNKAKGNSVRENAME